MMNEECSPHVAISGHQRPWHSLVFIIHCFLLATLLLGVATPARAADERQQMWLISTRSAPRCGDLDIASQELQYCRLDEHCQWIAADAQAFRATDDTTVPTIVFIHGNRTDADEAVPKAWYTYEIIRGEAANRPFRYVIWSWPAERVYRRNNDDIRLKAAYSDVESYYLARWLDGLRPGIRVSLIGHSFGPRIITGALHLLAGGAVADRSLSEGAVTAWTGGKRNPVRAVLLAAAVDADWLAPGGCHGLALSLVDQALITQNGCDRVLRWYPRLYDHGGSQAMGFVGPCGVEQSENVAVVDVSSTVGKIHDWRCYCSAANVRGLWPHYTFLDE
jgi:pimeloyl-ACP methyl ester carboxylesterase